ncbi:MAG: hypothetical protein O3A45_02860 [Proteobacteria bacterium]|jgi:hypothetical protein|nr:hypothetical protein [Pseudomonadota bacterium]
MVLKFFLKLSSSTYDKCLVLVRPAAPQTKVQGSGVTAHNPNARRAQGSPQGPLITGRAPWTSGV